MIQFLDLNKDNLLATVVNGKLNESEVELLHKNIHRILETNDKVRWYFEMNDFDGWKVEDLWEDLKMDAKHADDYEKIAMVGDAKWQDWMTQSMKPFTDAEIKFFDLTDRQKAKTWIQA